MNQDILDNNLINIVTTAEMLLNKQIYLEKLPESLFSGKLI